MKLPRGISSWITAEHMSFERVLNVGVSTFYRKPKGEMMDNFYEIWEIIHTEKFTDDMDGAMHTSVKSLLEQVVKINAEKRYAYFDEDNRVETFQPFEGELEIKIGDDYQKISVAEWKAEVETWLNAKN